MPNPTGVNGHGIKKKPDDEILQASLLKYRKQNQSQDQKIQSLKHDHNYEIGKTTLNIEENRLKIPSKRRLKQPQEVIKQAVIDEVEKDLGRRNGPDYIQQKLRHEHNLDVGRRVLDPVTRIMKEYFGDDFVKRFPGRKPVRENRTAQRSIGPFREVSADGHEKLARLALAMGDIGLSFYGYKDKWSSNILSLVVVPESRTAAAGGHIFLDFIEKMGCIPLQLTTDKGPEIGYQHAFMMALRESYVPEFEELAIIPAHVALKSTNNTPIEGFWRLLRQKTGDNLKEIILRGKNEAIFEVDVLTHPPLFYWIFVSLIQAELDSFCTYWNNHVIRTQEKKLMPSGHVPAFALEYPEQFGGIDCRVEIPREAVMRLREFLEEETHKSREACFEWYTDEFAVVAQLVWEDIGRPKITLESAWDVFSQMAPLVAASLV